MAHESQLRLFSDPPAAVRADHGPAAIGLAGVTYRDSGQILTKASGFMGEYDYTLNPYSGCAFGCTYCYAAFFARDPARRDSWGKWVQVKSNALEILSRPRQRAKLNGARIYMSSVTDAYQPIERELNLTRGLLEIMADGHTPKLVVQTRSPDVTRDIDLFHQIESNGGRVQVNMSVTTDDEGVRKTFEPQCPSNAQRIDALQEVNDAGIDSCITLCPFIWADDADAFADRLVETGITKVIIQPFKFTGGKFVAQTREGALGLMSEKLDCRPAVVQREYMKHYRHALSTFRTKLKSAGVHLGEGKDGFAPPF